MGSHSSKGHWLCYEEHPVFIIAPVSHMNKSLARFKVALSSRLLA